MERWDPRASGARGHRQTAFIESLFVSDVMPCESVWVLSAFRSCERPVMYIPYIHRRETTLGPDRFTSSPRIGDFPRRDRAETIRPAKAETAQRWRGVARRSACASCGSSTRRSGRDSRLPFRQQRRRPHPEGLRAFRQNRQAASHGGRPRAHRAEDKAPLAGWIPLVLRPSDTGLRARSPAASVA